MNEDRFEQLIDELRGETVSDAEVEAAVARVRERLETPVCAEFRSEFAGYIAGTLLESRRMLVDDHLGRCAMCRRALAEFKGEASHKVVAMPTSRWTGRLARYSRWAAAACLVAVGLYAGRSRIDSALAPSGPRATVESVQGQLIALASGRRLGPGAEVHEGDIVRTPSGSRATLRLRDGTGLEMNERSELLVRAAWSGLRIHLERGDVILQAAKQGRGRLQLTTRDATSSVKGTVFAVSTGIAGSVVSVVEGAVAVAQGGSERVLKPGEQVSTSDALQASGVREAIAWSPNADKYYALLAELASLEKQISAIIVPKLRTESRLLPKLLPSTLVYASIPNTDGAIDRSVRLVEQRARENAVVREWWDANGDFKAILERLQVASSLLGDEIAFLFATDPANRNAALPLILAEAKPGREAARREAMAKFVGVGTASTAYTVSGGLLLISQSNAQLAKIQSLLGRGAASPLASEIQRHYARGVGWLWIGDVGALMPPEPDAQSRAMFGVTGLAQVKYVAREQRGNAGRDDTEVSANFRGARQGIASWLATPGAFGSQEYISPESIAAVAATTRNPRQAFDELVNLAGRIAPGALGDLREFERATGINVSGEVVAAIGTDFSLSLERIGAPMIGWVGAIEVYSPAAVDLLVQRFIDAVNKDAKLKVAWSKETVNGRTWMSVANSSQPATIQWTYDRGYMVFGNDRALAIRAIAARSAGTPLVRSASFREIQPTTGTVHNSGFVWLNTRGALGMLLAASGSQVPAAFQSLLGSRDPVLIALNGETERIALFSRTRLTSLLIDLMLAAGGKTT